MGDSTVSQCRDRVGFFEEAPGVFSMGRLISFANMVMAIIAAVVGIIFRFPETWKIVTVFVSAAVAQKVGQKFGEGREWQG